jgi:hypothetical protein
LHITISVDSISATPSQLSFSTSGPAYIIMYDVMRAQPQKI